MPNLSLKFSDSQLSFLDKRDARDQVDMVRKLAEAAHDSEVGTR